MNNSFFFQEASVLLCFRMITNSKRPFGERRERVASFGRGRETGRNRLLGNTTRPHRARDAKQPSCLTAEQLLAKSPNSLEQSSPTSCSREGKRITNHFYPGQNADGWDIRKV
uniref:Uncharacterized protein n=1 Tax=Anguilla anguilla TaxID=7936 RepID=A0A0E9XCK4_ANGAN